MPCRYTPSIVALLLLAAFSGATAQNEIIANPEAVKLRRVWMVRGSVNGGEQIGAGAGSVGDVNGDSITDFAWYFEAQLQWRIQLGGRDSIPTKAYQILDSLGAVPSHPLVGNFYGNGRQYIMFPFAYIADSLWRFAMRFPLYPVVSDTISRTPVAVLEPSKTIWPHITGTPDEYFAVDLDQDGDDEMIIIQNVVTREDGNRDSRAEIWIYAGGPEFQLDTPTVVLKDSAQQDDRYFSTVADIDGDGYAEIITDGIYKGNPRPVKINFWWGNKDLTAISRQPDRTIDFTDQLLYPRLDVSITTLDCDGDGSSDLWFPGPDGQYLYRMGIAGKDARTRPLTLADADGVYGGYSIRYPMGYINDSLHRYAMSGGTAASPSGQGAKLVGISGGPNGPNHSYEVYYSAEFDGIPEGNVFGRGGPISDATGDGWDDYLTANPNWYGPLKQGIAILLAGGPYIPNDDPTVSVQEVSTSERSDALHLWPNPVRDILHIAWRGDLKRMPARMAVHDINGKMITEGAVQPGRGEALWRCASVAAGTYVLTIYDGRGEVIATEKVVKE